MLATVQHRSAGYTGELILGDGTALEFVNGFAGPIQITYADVIALTVMGYQVITSGSPAPPFDVSTDSVVAQIVASSASQTTAALKAAFVTATVDSSGGVTLYQNGVEL